MPKIEYEIELNESGRPCVKLTDDYKNKPENKFFAIEISRYLLQNIYNRRSEEFDINTANKLNDCITVLGQIADEMALILWKMMKELGDISLLTSNNYQIIVETIEDLYNLDKNYIFFSERIIKRQIGLKVLVTKEMKIYELINGIENENWKEI